MTRRPCPTEEQEQRTVAAYLDARPDLKDRWFHVPNGGARSKVAGARLKAMGVKRGVPDIWIVEGVPGYTGVVIELKRRFGGRVDPEQVAWLERLDGQNWMTGVCRGTEEAVDLIERMYGPPAARKPCPCEVWAKGKT